MSVERVELKDGSVVWRVRWRQGGRNRSKVLGRKRDAEAFDAELVRKKRTGELAQLDAGKELLSAATVRRLMASRPARRTRVTLRCVREDLGLDVPPVEADPPEAASSAKPKPPAVSKVAAPSCTFVSGSFARTLTFPSAAIR